MVIGDHRPVATHHLLVLPRAPILSVLSLEPTAEDVNLIEEMVEAGKQALRDLNAPGPESEWVLGFHVPPFTSVDHLHLHCIAGPLTWRGRLKFYFNRAFYASASAVLTRLQHLYAKTPELDGHSALSRV